VSAGSLLYVDDDTVASVVGAPHGALVLAKDDCEIFRTPVGPQPRSNVVPAKAASFPAWWQGGTVRRLRARLSPTYRL